MAAARPIGSLSLRKMREDSSMLALRLATSKSRSTERLAMAGVAAISTTPSARFVIASLYDDKDHRGSHTFGEAECESFVLSRSSCHFFGFFLHIKSRVGLIHSNISGAIHLVVATTRCTGSGYLKKR